MRRQHVPIAILALTAGVSLPVHSIAASIAWGPQGIPLAVTPEHHQRPVVASDGADGIFVLSRRDFGRLVLHRLGPTGAPAPGWPAEGLMPVSTNPQVDPWLLSDGAGGVFLVWADFRVGVGTAWYALRLLSDGTVASGWPALGLMLADPAQGAAYIRAVSHEDGSLLVIWANNLGGGIEYPPALNVLKFDRNGYAPGFEKNGVLHWGHGATEWHMIPDHSGGFVIVKDLSAGVIHRFNSTGAPVYQVTIANGLAGSGTTAIDPAGNVTTVWNQSGLLYAARRSSSGAALWTSSGLSQVAGAVVIQQPTVVHDGATGVYLIWLDGREVCRGWYAAHVLADGTVIPPAGRRFAEASNEGLWPVMSAIPDGAGGVLVSHRGGTCDDPQLYLMRLGPGAADVGGWPAGGLLLRTDSVGEMEPSLSTDGNAAHVAWREQPSGNHDTRAQRVILDEATAVAVSMREPEVEAGVVSLSALVAGVVHDLRVERRDGDEGWNVRASVVADGAGWARFEDRDVIAGERYGYRFAWRDDGVEAVSETYWVTVPGGTLRLVVEPNPSPRDLAVSVQLATTAHDATLELFDAGGRRLAERTMAATAVTERVMLGRGLAPGIYLVRVRQGGDVASARAVVIE